MKKVETKSAKDILNEFDKIAEMIREVMPKNKEYSELIKGVGLLLEQMKSTREISILLREKLKEELDEKFQEEAIKLLMPILEKTQKKAKSIDSFKTNQSLFSLPDNKEKIFFEVMAEMEDISKLPTRDSTKRERIDKNIKKLVEFEKFVKDHQSKIEEERKQIFGDSKKPIKILQLKIYLKGITPKIWRKFQVKNNITFHQLHLIIQKVMDWDNYHLYSFDIGNIRLESEELAEGECGDFEPSEKIKLCQLIEKEKIKFEYVYDFGDCWEHSIIVEKILEEDNTKQYPVCIDGERACPPEDCGSIWGYAELMKIRKNKNHSKYREMIVEWLGEDYDPELFILDWVNAKLQGKRLTPVWVKKN